MSLAFSLIIVGILIFIAYQDFKFRAITWLLFPLLSVVVILDNIYNHKMAMSFEYYLLNVMFVLVQLAVITLYLSLKSGAFVKIWVNHLGLGDILFFFILCIFFPPVNFIIFYLGSLMFTILLVVALKKFYSSFSLIPLAGIQSALLAVLIITDHFVYTLDYKTDVNVGTIF